VSIDISALKQRAKIKLHGINDTVTLSRQGASYWMGQPAIGVDPNNPFKSKSQQRFMFAKKPKLAKKWAKKTKNIKGLPKKVRK